MSTDAPDTGTTEPTPQAPETPPDAPETPDTGGTDLTAELDKWKAQARKHEERAKANAAAAKQLEQLKRETMSDLEKAVDEARRQARTEVLTEVGSERVADAVRVALAGRSVDVDALLEGLDRTRFLTEDGTPDRDGIAAWVDRIAPKTDAPAPAVDLGQGVRPGASIPLNGDPILRDLQSKLGIR